MDERNQPARPSDTTAGEMLEQILDVSTGVGILLLPLWLVFVPGVLLLLVLPVVLLLAVIAAPIALAGVLLAPPYLLVRAVRRHRRRARASRIGAPSLTT